jgi:hypothetical protein
MAAPTNAANVKKALANSEPSTHGTQRNCQACTIMSAERGIVLQKILSILSRNIDSRSGANAQQRFKGARAPIRSLQISISQRLLGDFCNTIRGRPEII